MIAALFHSPPNERQLLRRFWQSASGYWSGAGAWKAWLLVCLLVVTLLLQLLTQYRLNFWNRDFFNAIGRRDQQELWVQALRFIPLAGASLALAIFSVWVRMTTQRKWREWFSKELYAQWIDNGHSINLQFVSGDHQAPEFRIAEDARVATDLPIDLALGLLSSFLTGITFIGVLLSVGGSLFVDVFGIGLTIPGYLVIAVVVYSVLQSTAMALIARHLTKVFQETKRTEAELRFLGSRLREESERDESTKIIVAERRAIFDALNAVIEIWRRYCWQLMRMTLVSQTNILLTPVVALLICSPKYLTGQISLGEVVQAAAAFVIVQGAFNWFTDSYGRIAEWAASANRVASLLMSLDQLEDRHYVRAEPMQAGQ